MEEFVEISVNDQNEYIRRNIPLLQALKEKNIILPSLCFSSKLEPYGSCGLCILEIYGENSWKVKHACLTQAEDGLRIRTMSARISKLQAQAARFLLKRGPFLKQEAEELLLSLINQSEEGYNSGSYKDINAGCILCGLCVRICKKTGNNKLVFLGKGKNLRVGLVGGSQPDICNHCKACRHICPTGFISHDARNTKK